MMIKVVVTLIVLTVSILANGATNTVVNKSAGVTTAASEQMKREDDESFLARLRRLRFNASLEDEDTIRFSMSGGDVPVYINAKAHRDVSGNVYYTAFKMYGKWYIPKSKQSLKLLRTRDSQKSGWQLLPLNNCQCIVMYCNQINHDISDSKLVDAILAVQRTKLDQFPIGIDAEYQRRWSVYFLGLIIFTQEEKDENILKDEDDLVGYCKHSIFN